MVEQAIEARLLRELEKARAAYEVALGRQRRLQALSHDRPGADIRLDLHQATRATEAAREQYREILLTFTDFVIRGSLPRAS